MNLLGVQPEYHDSTRDERLGTKGKVIGTVYKAFETATLK